MAAVLVVLDWLLGSLRRGTAPAQRAWTDAPAVGAVVAVALAAPLVVGDGVTSADGVAVAWGVATMLVAAAAGWLLGRPRAAAARGADGW